MDGLWQLAFALLAFAYLYRYSKTELETDKFYEDPPQIAPRVRIRRNRRSSASLNSHPRDDKIERVQERLLAARQANSTPLPVTTPSEPEHENDQVRREMGVGRARPLPPHFDTRHRAPLINPIVAANQRNNARKPVRVRSNELKEHCGACNRDFDDAYSLDKHNLAAHPERAERKPSFAGSDDALDVPVEKHCETCLQDFHTAVALLQHNEACHPELWLAGCFMCGVPRFKTGDEQRIHYRTRHPARTLPSTGPSAANGTGRPRVVRNAAQKILNPTLVDTVITQEPDRSLPPLQQTYGCEMCAERFNTAEESEAHRASPFPHGDPTALNAAFPPLSSSTSSSSSTSLRPTSGGRMSGQSPTMSAAIHDSETMSVSSESETEKPFNSLEWALKPLQTREAPTYTHEDTIPVFEYSSDDSPQEVILSDSSYDYEREHEDEPEPEPEPLIVDDGSFSPDPNLWPEPELPPPAPVVHHWKETDPADIPLPESPIFNPDPAVAIDQPLPLFSISSGDYEDSNGFQHPKTELVHHVGVGFGNPDGSESVVVPSPYNFGEIMPDPVPPGMDAFPELPSRDGGVTPQPKAQLKVEGASRWHTDDKADFDIPDMSPKLEQAKRNSKSYGDGWERSEATPIETDESGWETRAQENDQVHPEPEQQPTPKRHPAHTLHPDRQPPSWVDRVDEEYRDEIPAAFAGFPPSLTDTNNIPLGPRRGGPPPGGSAPAPAPASAWSNLPPPAPMPTAQPSRYGQQLPNHILRPAYPAASGIPQRPMPQIAPQSQRGFATPPHLANGGYGSPPVNDSYGRQQPIHNGGYNSGYASNGSFQQPYSPDRDMQQQLPSFSYNKPDASFNAFPAVDPLGPLPAPVHAQPSAWMSPTKAAPSHLPLGMSPSNSPSPISPPAQQSMNSSMFRGGQSESGMSETSSGDRRYGSQFGGGIGPGSVSHPAPGTRGRWADRAAPAPQAPFQQQPPPPPAPFQQQAPPPPAPPAFDAASGWNTTVPAIAPRRKGGKVIGETFAEKEARKKQEELDRLQEIEESQEAGFGGW